MHEKTPRSWVWVAAALAGVLSVLSGWAVWQRTLTQGLEETARRGDNVLQLAATALSGQLDRFERLPPLIAESEVIRALANAPRDPQLAERANLYLERIQGLLGASDVYLMDTDGLTIAASNHGTDTSFIGGDFSFRPYFYEAMRGILGRYYALGTTSGKRGYYFGAPVMSSGALAGVLVFKIDLDAIEETWRGGDYAVLVTDPDGVVFLSSRSDWLFQTLYPLPPAAKARIQATRRYADGKVGNLDIVAESEADGLHLMSLGGAQGPREYVQRDLEMPSAGWSVQVLIDTHLARRAALTAAVVVMLSVGLMALLGVVLWQRRLRLDERLQMQQAARADLERRVEERTHELAGLNHQLEAEIAERRQAQADLIQAGKLAALGQMSAALSHEFNQPLAAARTYADNAGVLMDRGRLTEARSNIDRIMALIDRMTAISRHLRSFARTPGQKLSAVRVSDVIEAAVEIAALRLRAAKVELQIDLPPDLPLVVAGPVRLQQVLVNILTNAADAVEEQGHRHVVLRAVVDGQDVVIGITDTGPGVPESLVSRIFDPFFSTKGVGKGLGLGLSISYNIIKDFGGDLTVKNVAQGGAEFCIRLRIHAAQIVPEAAE
jgi:two-component system, NtrC family, C4-dicarboxylate transport sensor histidine kinase DctB